MSIETLSDDAFVRVTQLTTRPAKTGEPGKPDEPAKPGLLGISRTSLYRLIDARKFPKPVRPLPGVVAWRAGDVRQWLRSHSPS